MELFNYADIGWLAANSRVIFTVCLALAGVAFVLLMIFAFTRATMKKKVLWIFVAILITAAIGTCAALVNGYTKTVFDEYSVYKTAYDEGRVSAVRGEVENFEAGDTSVTFSLAGVDFAVNGASVTDEAVLYYTYADAAYDSAQNAAKFYTPSPLVITGNGQSLEIHFVNEDGQNRIIYIKAIEN